MNRIIVAISGGKASAWCSEWAIKKFGKEKVLLYFNDVKWEHPDLYRFLDDLKKYLGHEITEDSDGRSPENLFYDQRAIANSRWPFCSRILKAERLQKFIKDGDLIIFGIGSDEPKRASRIMEIYGEIAKKKKIKIEVDFPLIRNGITSRMVDEWLKDTGIEPPILYKLGFKHNNCSGGCVRAGKKHWRHLLETLPEVYAERERVEEAVKLYLGKEVNIFKDESLKQFRERVSTGQLTLFDDLDDGGPSECIGICSLEN